MKMIMKKKTKSTHRQVKINFKIWILYYSAKKKKKGKLTTNILKTIKKETISKKKQ